MKVTALPFFCFGSRKARPLQQMDPLLSIVVVVLLGYGTCTDFFVSLTGSDANDGKTQTISYLLEKILSRPKHMF